MRVPPMVIGHVRRLKRAATRKSFRYIVRHVSAGDDRAGGPVRMRLDETELHRWGRRIGEELVTPAVIALTGPLGAGKSALARAIGAGAGVDDAMPSPSHSLVFRYPTPSGRDVVHLDLYRLSSSDDVWELGWSQLGAEHEIVLIEWAERARDLLPHDHWVIELSVPPDHVHLRDVAVRRVGAPPELPGFPMSVSVSAG